jgi:hypothetical protein
MPSRALLTSVAMLLRVEMFIAEKKVLLVALSDHH